jgi:hypothetical protein
VTRAERERRIGALVLEILELAAPTHSEKPEQRPRVVVDDVARQRAQRALDRLGVTTKRGGR